MLSRTLSLLLRPSSFSTKGQVRAASVVATKRLPISQFGRLNVQADCTSVEVTSLNPGYHPKSAPKDLDDRTEAFFEVISLDEHAQIDESDVLINAWGPEELVEVQAFGKNIILKAWIPFSCSVGGSGEGDFTLRNMEGGCFNYCGEGNCYISKSKLRSFEVMTGGNIICDSIQGNISFDSTRGGIYAGKFQSEKVTLNAYGENPIEIETLLTNIATIRGGDGHVTIGHFHGDISVETRDGDIEISSGDGSLSASSTGSGQIRTHVAATTTVNSLIAPMHPIQFTVDDSDQPAPTTIEGFVAEKTPFIKAWQYKGELVNRIREHRPSFPKIDIAL